jgi:hypothetical protein
MPVSLWGIDLEREMNRSNFDTATVGLSMWAVKKPCAQLQIACALDTLRGARKHRA